MKKYEYNCPECKGRGIIIIRCDDEYFFNSCFICDGSGICTWIDIIKNNNTLLHKNFYPFYKKDDEWFLHNEIHSEGFKKFKSKIDIERYLDNETECLH